MTDTTEELTITQQFDALILDVGSYTNMGKALSARIKTIQKEVAKTSKPKGKVKRVREPLAEGEVRKPSALEIPVKISEELCLFLGFDASVEHSRRDVTSGINTFIKDNGLQNPENKRFILMEGSEKSVALCKLLRTPDQPVTFFNIQRYLKPHYPLSAKDLKALAAAEAPDAPTEEKKVPVKKVPVKKTTGPDVVPDADVVDETPAVVEPEKKKPVRRVIRAAA